MARHIHTQVETPKIIRKSILETALHTTETIKLTKRLQEIREEKTIVKDTLRKTLKKLQTDVTTLKKSIPPLPKEFIQRQQSKKPKAEKQKKEIKIEQSLEADITSIKERIQSLNL